MTAVAASLASCGERRTNPLLAEPQNAYGIIDYELIVANDFREAIREGMRRQKESVAAIVANAAQPDFENTIAAFDRSDDLLHRAALTFENLSLSNSNDSIRELETELSPLLAQHNDDIYLDRALFARVKAVHDRYIGQENPADTLTHEQLSVVRHIYRDFVRAGAALADEEQKELRALNLEISNLQVKFSQNLLHETNNTFVVADSVAELAGLPQANIDAAAQMAREQGQEGKFMFNMQRPSCNPVLQFCANRDLRRRIYEAYCNRGNRGNEWDNREICNKLVKLRLRRANLLGYKSCAEQILADRMAASTEEVYDLLSAVWQPAVEKAHEELADIRREMRKDGFGRKEEPEGWDYMYYSTRAKAARYGTDEEALAKYFELNNVINGVFYVANKLYGLSFREITGTVPTYEPTARTWEVTDRDGKTLALFYGDYFPRDGKAAGAWMSDMREQGYVDGQRIIPIVQNVCNLTRGTGDSAALQSIDNVTTLFHEFGHALHFMMHDVHYRAVYNPETDYIEMPSQLNEHWALQPEVLAVYAKHCETGEVIPADVVQRIVDSGKYGQGFATTEFLAAAIVDMDLHSLTYVPDSLDVIEFEEETLAKWGIPRQIMPRYRVTNFSHSMGGGYTAGYYCYLLSEVLDCDVFEAYTETGDIFNAALAEKFRKTCLEPGGIDDGMTMFRRFRGRDPRVDALLRNRGLK